MSLSANKAGKEWIESAIEDFISFLRNGPAPLERWKEDWLKRQKPVPLSQNAYGSITRIAAGRGLIKKTGSYIQARSVAARARAVAVWSLVN